MVQISAKHKEWQELVPQLISGDIKKLTAVVDAHHRREKMLASLRSRYALSSLLFLLLLFVLFFGRNICFNDFLGRFKGDLQISAENSKPTYV